MVYKYYIYICSEKLNESVFDELIRQITINLPERGIMAVRIKNEAKMTIDTYQTLYEGSLAFGMRKSIESKQEIINLKNEIEKYKKINNELKNNLESKQNEKLNFEKYYSDVKAVQNKKFNEEIDFLKHQINELELHLKSHQDN